MKGQTMVKDDGKKNGVAPTKVGADVVVTNFPGFMQEVRKGQLVFDCAQKLEELVGAVREHGKSGKMTITFDIGPLSGKDSDTVGVLGDVQIKKPRKDISKAIFFTTKKNTLQKEDPRQDQMDLDA